MAPDVKTTLLTEADLTSGPQDPATWPTTQASIEKLHRLLNAFKPTLIVLCRYSGPCAAEIIEWARAARTPTIYHIDDDLLQVPREIGEAKARSHNQPRRLRTVRYLLDHATLAYCSNERLRRKLFGDVSSDRIVSADVNCAIDILAPPTTDGPPVIGYMGFGSHDFDFTFALPGLVRILDARPDVRFEIFGSIALPQALERFSDRIRLIEQVRDYGRFLEKLSSLRWTIGICPLARTEFNFGKSNNKWVEYSACGFAVVATRGLIYDDCCAEGRGLLVDGDDEWFEAFDTLLRDKAFHRAQVLRAQQHLRDFYSRDRLRRQIATVFARAHSLADKPDGTRLSLDEFDGDRIWGWAWRSTETSIEPQRQPVELWCGDVLVGRITRRQDRPDVDAYLGATKWPKGFSAPIGALNALCRLMGGDGGAFHPSIRFREESISTYAHDPRWRNGFQTLRAMDNADFRIADAWWGNSHLLKMRASVHPGDDEQAGTKLFRLFQPSRHADGRLALAIVDESPVDGQRGVYALGVRNPFMPILLVGYDESSNIVFTDLIPFPSLLRGGLHAAEMAALDDAGGGLDAFRQQSDAYLAEAFGLSYESSPAIGEVCVDLLAATGAEPIFEPQFREWLALVFGVALSTANGRRRIAADLGDPAFVEFAEGLLGQTPPAQHRNGRLRLTLPCCAVPTIDALVSRRLTAHATPGPAPCLIVDRSFPYRRFFVALPPALSEEVQTVITARQDTLPALSLLTDEDGSAVEQARPAAIVMRDLGPRGRESILYPVARNEDINLSQRTGAPGVISVFVRLGEDDSNIRLLLDSLMSQRTGARVEVILLVQRSRQANAARDALNETFPVSGRVTETDSTSSSGATLNKAAAAASGETFVFLDSRIILHDERTLDTIAALSGLQGAGTAGCMMIKPRNATDGGAVFGSAGYFPARLDFSTAPHLALEQLDCSTLLVDTVYPVAANSPHLYALSAEAWRNVGGMNACFSDYGMQIDLALRLASAGRVNICTTLVSALSEADERPKHLHNMAATSHLDIWRLLPALKSSAIIRAF
ncbi:MAG: hypothetical protein ACM3PD_03330 [Chloroflexota bacterium]